LGHVTERDLVGIYSNAICTFFPFTNEPFGYVPIESMACGTPVVTYSRQGPAETVVQNSTGWLEDDRRSFFQRGLSVWESGTVPEEMRDACRRRALEYSEEVIAEKWLHLLDSLP
jgi:glycosyltransferase involved in cell wall biosynthesis